MLHLQGESGDWGQNAGAAMQAHVPPSLLKALAGIYKKKHILVHCLKDAFFISLRVKKSSF